MGIEKGSAFLLKVGDGAAVPAFATVAGLRTTQLSVNGEAIADMYGKSADTIGSDYNKREALMALMATDHFGPHAADAVLDGAARITSSYDRAQVLVALARVMPLDDKHVARYRDLAAQLSQSDRNKVENALVF